VSVEGPGLTRGMVLSDDTLSDYEYTCFLMHSRSECLADIF
jgi:hypothetical protein